MRLIYVFTDVPHQDGTFAVAEVEAMAAHGLQVELLCLRSRLTEAEAARDLRSRFQVWSAPYLSPGVLASTLRTFIRRPIWFLRSLIRAIADTIDSPRILVKTLAILPKCCHLAGQIQTGRRIDELVEETLLMAFWASLPARGAWWMSELTGIPYATWAHAGSDIYNRNHQTEAALLTVLRGARFVLTCNQANVEYFGRILEQDALAKVVYHPHGVDLGRFEFREKEPPRDPQGATKMLSVGRLNPAKGFHIAVEACAELARRGVDFRYRIIGEGPLRGQLESAIRKYGLEGKVELLGYREQSELPAEYYAADLYLAPSIVGPKGARDGLPNVLLEAMASGAVVVGSNAVGIPEAVEDGVTGVLAAPGDACSITDAIERLAGDPVLRGQLRTQAVRLVHECYGRRQCMERVAEIYGSRGERIPPWKSRGDSHGGQGSAGRVAARGTSR